MPASLPDIAKPLGKYAPEEDVPQFTYPDLIHDDMERQNILSVDNAITGLVDLDSIRLGDKLYEYGHFMFNFVFCDPKADFATAALYIDELINAGMVNPKDIYSLYSYIYQFAISDVVDFQDLTQNPVLMQHAMIDMNLLVHQYDHALSFASNFFRSEFPQTTIPSDIYP